MIALVTMTLQTITILNDQDIHDKRIGVAIILLK